MAGNTFGSVFRVTTFGESHGTALGCVIDGCPAGLAIDKSEIQKALNRRRPGGEVAVSAAGECLEHTQCEGAYRGDESGGAESGIKGKANPAVTERKEADEVEILSGVYQGVTEGTPIALLIRNTAQHSKDYDRLRDTFRPGHADITYYLKWGHRDPRGGGRSSGRETAARVAAGAVAQKLLSVCYGTKIRAYTTEAAGIKAVRRDMDEAERNMMRAPDSEAATRMLERIAQLKEEGDSCGGVVECTVTDCPAGLGEPVFDKADALLAHAMLSIGAVKAIEFGAGAEAAAFTGEKDNDAMYTEDGKVRFASNNAGGILGGISRGDDIVFRVGIKPVPSIFKKQKTVCITGGKWENCDLVIVGRHDVCLCPRIVPVVEAMTAITLADMALRNRAARVGDGG